MSSKSVMDMFQEDSYLSGANAEYVETLYEQYLSSPEELEPEWLAFFSELSISGSDVSHRSIRDAFKKMAKQPAMSVASGGEKQTSVNALIDAFRRLGYRHAKTNPLHHAQIDLDSRLTLAAHDLSSSDLSSIFDTGGLLPKVSATLQEIVDRLNEIYLGTIGYDIGHILNEEESVWLTHQIEAVVSTITLSKEVRLKALEKVVQADTLERYLEKKYVAQKRFSLEGNDALVPLVDRLITLAAKAGTKEIIFGMAHRGRVNVLINNLGMNPGVLYEDFEGPQEFGETTGDLKYHRGFSNDVQTEHGSMHLSLMFNPSHLEFVSPVIMGSIRARQSRHPGSQSHDYALPIIMHGDAAFSGEGIVMETLNMSKLRAYDVGGSIHVIVNNQIGFTTCDVRDARTSFAASDVAKIIEAPVFHVNADDIDAVQITTQLAHAYRQRFHKDVVIDLFGYRRHGHQEADEPSATAPLLYKSIREHTRAIDLYAKTLMDVGLISSQDIEAQIAEHRRKLDASESVCQSQLNGLSEQYQTRWDSFIGKQWRESVPTAVEKEKLMDIASALFNVPAGFELQKQVAMMVRSRQKMATGELPMDWGFAENLAYATLVKEGHSVRLVGQDSRRGTFSHRHSTLYDQLTGEEFVALREIAKDASQIEIYDSPLNEAGALGFEYGYTVAEPQKLVIWEAQFGDFYNPAQVVVDQFISSGWQKWRRLSGLVMLLPHGCEGAGPEHSSARIERFLQLCAQQNIQVFVPSTPAQMFHLLRRQILRSYRRPLIVMTPKSLLRNKLAVSSIADLTEGELQMVIPEMDALDTSKVERVVLCCGKVYFDLLARRRKLEETRVALIRVEQLYPFPYEELTAILASYGHVKQVVWCQEEPKNQGAWFVTCHRLWDCLHKNQTLAYVGRKPYAAPASGFIALHKQHQDELVNRALDLSVELTTKDRIDENE